MSLSFIIIALVTLAGAVAAMSLRNLVHCALALTAAFAGLAAAYLQLGAQFAGFAQILVYIGAVAILIVFAILLTAGNQQVRAPLLSSGWAAGLGIALVVFGVLGGIVLSSKVLASRPLPKAPAATVRQLGDELMRQYILPLEVAGLLLTAALIGAVVLAMQEKKVK